MTMSASATTMTIAPKPKLEAGPCCAPASPKSASMPYPAPEAVVNRITE